MRIYVPLDPEEVRLLGEMCRKEYRSMRDQVRFVLREAARRRGLLPPCYPAPTVDSGEEDPHEQVSPQSAS